MSLKKYRIIESDVFYVQKQRKYIGWRYLYNIEKTAGKQFIFGAIAVIHIIVMSILGLCSVHCHWASYMLTPLCILIISVCRRAFIHKFTTIDAAKAYINKRVQEEEDMKNLIEIERQKTIEKKKKRANKKVIYLDIEAERAEKLKRLK